MGESKVRALSLAGAATIAAYLAMSSWTAYVAYALQHSAPLLGSLVANLFLFVIAMLTKNGTTLRLSWIWLGANFMTAQAVLLPGTSYLIAVGSAVVFLLAFDLSSFLELTFPMKIRGRDFDSCQYERTRLLLEKHAAVATMYVAAAGVLALAGITVYTPVVSTHNPVLLVGILASVILVLAALLSSELRTDRQPKGY